MHFVGVKPGNTISFTPDRLAQIIKSNIIGAY
jgi:hypothetical protein